MICEASFDTCLLIICFIRPGSYALSSYSSSVEVSAPSASLTGYRVPWALLYIFCILLFIIVGVNLWCTTFKVCEITLFYLDRVLKLVKMALSMYFSSRTLSKGSIMLVYSTPPSNSVSRSSGLVTSPLSDDGSASMAWLPTCYLSVDISIELWSAGKILESPNVSSIVPSPWLLWTDNFVPSSVFWVGFSWRVWRLILTLLSRSVAYSCSARPPNEILDPT